MDPKRVTLALWGKLWRKFPQLPTDPPTLCQTVGESWWYDGKLDRLFYPLCDLRSWEVFVYFLGHELVHRACLLLGNNNADEDSEEIAVDALSLEILPKSRVGWLWAMVRWGFGDDFVREDGSLTAEGEELCQLYEMTKDNPLWGGGNT